jgi:hypothetical protein
MPHPKQESVWVSDNEPDTGLWHTQSQWKAQTKPCRLGSNVTQQWKNILCQLTRVGTRGNERPEFGQYCLVMTGKANQDLGQMGVVTTCTPSMVEIAYV